MLKRVFRVISYYLLFVIGFILVHVLRNPHRTLRKQQNQGFPGKTLETVTETDNYRIVHIIEDGIERISYIPHEKTHQTPIVMQHGMWHGAWCWERWQHLLAENGWESHAHSLPGHALSPVQRPISRCTMDYYLSFLKREMERHERTPILMGHSMGGGLAQWYLKYVDDDLPATVLVAPWIADSTMADGTKHIGMSDIMGMFVLPWFTLSATPWVRNPRRAAQKLIGPGADITPEELHARLGPESLVAVLQHNPPFWTPPRSVKTPVLLLAGEIDAVCSTEGERATAEHYNADFVLVDGAAHNLMMDKDYGQTAQRIHAWLSEQEIT